MVLMSVIQCDGANKYNVLFRCDNVWKLLVLFFILEHLRQC